MELHEIIAPLIAWYREVERPLPWRADRSPYHVWLSEIMLQQTRIEAVIPYYHRFLEAFPEISDLAMADDDHLLKLWEGLGYYSRARNLKKAAAAVVENYGGQLPDTAEQLKKLPGIGDYTAGAIASIAFGQPEPAIDGNVLRVYTRLTACGEDIAQTSTKKMVGDALREIYPSGDDAACLTQGLMELGQQICIPKGVPHCENCPLADLCRAHKEGSEQDFPVISPKAPRTILPRTVFILRREGKYALQRRPEGGLLAGLWEFPALDGVLDKAAAISWLAGQGLAPGELTAAPPARHIFTHREWEMCGWAADVSGEGPVDWMWATPEELNERYAIASAYRVYRSFVEKTEPQFPEKGRLS